MYSTLIMIMILSQVVLVNHNAIIVPTVQGAGCMHAGANRCTSHCSYMQEPPDRAPPSSFYYVSASTNERRGPTPLAALPALCRAGELAPESLCWAEGLPEWMPLHRFVVGEAAPQPKPKPKPKPHAPPAQAQATVLVGNIPPEVTREEFARLCASKCGVIRRGLDDGEEMVKLLEDDQGKRQGDGLVTFVNAASVDLAKLLLDEYEIRPGVRLRVTEREQDATAAPAFVKKRPANADDSTPAALERALKVRRLQEKHLMGWSDGDGPVKEPALCIVVLKNLFDPVELAKHGKQGVADLEQDLVEGLTALRGEIKKVTLFTKHPEGVCLIRFVDPVDAEECVRIMRGRWFDGRRLDAALWDGVTQYAPPDDVDGRVEDEARRMEEFAEWVETTATSTANPRPATPP